MPATNSAKTEAKPSAKASAVAKEVADLQAKIKAYEDKMKALKAAKKPNDDPELVGVKNELKKANTELAGHFMFSKLKGQVLCQRICPLVDACNIAWAIKWGAGCRSVSKSRERSMGRCSSSRIAKIAISMYATTLPKFR